MNIGSALSILSMLILLSDNSIVVMFKKESLSVRLYRKIYKRYKVMSGIFFKILKK